MMMEYFRHLSFCPLCKLFCVVSCLSSQLWPTSKSCPQLVIFSNFIFLAFHFQKKYEQSKTCTSQGFSRSPKSSCSPFHLSLALRRSHWWCHCCWCFWCGYNDKDGIDIWSYNGYNDKDGIDIWSIEVDDSLLIKWCW